MEAAEAEDLPPSERPTPRQTSPIERGKLFKEQAKLRIARMEQIAFEAAQVGTTDIQRGVEARLLAGRAKALVEAFETWERGEATHEQRVEDQASWLILSADARALDAKAPRTKNTAPAMLSPWAKSR